MPLPPPTPEPETKATPAKPKPQKVAIASPSPKASPTPKPSVTQPKAAQPPSSTQPAPPISPRIVPQQEPVITIPKTNTSPSPNPSPSVFSSPNPSPSSNQPPSPSPSSSPISSGVPLPNPSLTPSPSPAPVSFAGEVLGELGATPGCNGKEGCWQVAGNWRQTAVDSSPLMARLRSQGYDITEHRSDDFLQVYALTKNRESRYLYLLNSPEISLNGEQRTLTLINSQGDLNQSQIEALALNPAPTPTS